MNLACIRPNLHFFKLDCVKECGSLQILGDKVNNSPKLGDNKLRNNETKANAVGVDLLFLILDRPKHLEQFVLVLFLDTNAIVCDGDHDKVGVTIYFRFLLILYEDHDFAVSVGKLDCVGENVKEHLLDSLLVAVHDEAIVFKPNEVLVYLKGFHLDFVFLDLDNLIDGLPDVELVDRLCKVLLFLVQDRVVEHVMHEIVDKL